VRREDALYPRRTTGIGTLTLSNQRLVFEVHVRTGIRKVSSRPVIEIRLEHVQSTHGTPGEATESGRGVLQVQTSKGIDEFMVKGPEDWVEDISNAKLALPPPPEGAAPRTQTINVHVHLSPAGVAPPPPARVRCPYCKSVYDESKGRCPSCGARFY
jgi:hypothetical protein